ncbi:MAG: class I SAM-dependent rRNA methyltransferase [Pseudomonadota bacterium]
MSRDALDRPIVRLRPKAGRRFYGGAPWVYADEIVMDRRTKAIAPGTVVQLQDEERIPQATFAFNPESGIAGRLLDRDPEAPIDPAWLRDRLAAAVALRKTVAPGRYHRLVHAEADGLPGLVIDRFGDAAVIQPNAAWADLLRAEIAEALAETTGVATILVNGTSRARSLEGLPEETFFARGDLSAPIEVPMNGALYLADLVGGQKTGLYFDQRPNHAFVASLASGAEVLDVFSHVGGFALAALAAGATSALAVDGSQPALDLASEAAARMGVADRLENRRSDAFKALDALATEQKTFDVVICDPPAFAPAKSALKNGLRAYERTARLAARLTRPGGFLTLCSCSHAASPERFREACASGIASARRDAQLIREGQAGPDHPVHPHLPETAYLKAITYRVL